MSNEKIAIALSGGGVRAMAYQSGFLKFLAEQDRLQDIKKISSVSGGSLLVGLIFKENDYRWPSSEKFQSALYDKVRTRLTTQNLQGKALLALCNPVNWRYIFSRANLLALLIKKSWGITANLSQLPDSPEWSINATTLENGCRFRFKAGTCGDYSLGYAKSEHFPLANAMAISAAIPGGIGPLVINSEEFQWYKKPEWYGASGTEVTVTLPFKKLHLSDGGVYDNLGLEPFFDSGKNQSKVKSHSIYVLDAGSPLIDKNNGSKLNPLRLKRIIDITMEQSRALRIRSFLHYLIKSEGEGAYSGIGHHVQRLLPDHKLSFESWLSPKQVEWVERYPTHLKKMTESDFDLIARHGYESAKALSLKSTDCQA